MEDSEWRKPRRSEFDMRPSSPITRISLVEIGRSGLGTHTHGNCLVQMLLLVAGHLKELPHPQVTQLCSTTAFTGGSWGIGSCSVEINARTMSFEFSATSYETLGGRACTYTFLATTTFVFLTLRHYRMYRVDAILKTHDEGIPLKDH
ncbi:hypothetical protein Tco_0681138 [Tanacetum coccineum]|uniref:Uncharacterized protein n=1 Tax=Tanacetum coccineum TaxID=301880 RepID=A0ABQ4XMH1_9ASTR